MLLLSWEFRVSGKSIKPKKHISIGSHCVRNLEGFISKDEI
jgi:hypothetical protein